MIFIKTIKDFLEYSELKTHNSKRKWIAVMSFGGSCGQCGYAKCLMAIDFHHIDPTTKSKILIENQRNKNSKSILVLPNKLLVEELEKCICVCKNCHMEIEYGLIENPNFDNRFDRELFYKLKAYYQKRKK